MLRFATMLLVGTSVLHGPVGAQTVRGALPSSALKLPRCQTSDFVFPVVQEGAVDAPAAFLEEKVEVGEPVLASYSASVLQSELRILKPVQIRVERGTSRYLVSIPAEVLIPADIQTVLWPDHILRYHLVNATMQIVNKDGQVSDPRRASLWLYLATDATTLRGELKVGSLIPYEVSNAPISRETCFSPHNRGLRREILYGGVVKNAVTLQYREFLDGVARPAFSQEGTFDLSSGSEVAFKGVHIKIVSASNVGLRYVILKGFSAD